MKKYFFLHIPKTAGSSLFTFFRDVLGEGNVFQVRDVKIGGQRAETLKDYSMVGGHLTYNQMETYFEPERYRVVFLRHPVDRLISLYYFHRSAEEVMHDPTVRLTKEMDLQSYITYLAKAEIQDGIRNAQVWHMTGDVDIQLKPIDRLEMAKENLDKMDFIGLTENFADSVDLLSIDCQWPPVQTLPQENITIKRPFLQDLSGDLVSRITETAALDVELYKYGVKLYETKKRQLLRECIQQKAITRDSIFLESTRPEVCTTIDIPGNPLVEVKETTQQRNPQGATKSEFGSKEIEIICAEVCGVESGSSILKSGEEAHIRVFIQAKVTEKNLSIGLRIEDEYRQTIYGTNSHHMGQTVFIHSEETVVVNFKLRMDLCEGAYLLTVALHQDVADRDKCYHWKDRVSDFIVSGNIGFFAQGIARLYPTQHLTVVKPSEPLPMEVAQLVSLRAKNVPSETFCSERFNCKVEVSNNSAYVLTSYPPNPVHISYHWLAADGKTVIFDGERSRLLEAIDPRSRRKLGLSVLTPRTPGDYILRITLVQEQAFWFDQVSTSAYLDFLVKVE
ncbi:MAG: Wzt carbohydrate-binding domain-containing protein [Desulfitobacteriaceae bacterium]